MKDSICSYCINKQECNKCDKGWHDMFVPSDEVREYFQWSYIGIRGMNGYIYDFDTTNKNLKPTHSVKIHGRHCCPYCAEPMYPIQEPKTLRITGYTCICRGARAELAYEAEKTEIEKRHRKELHILQEQYRKRLSFNTEKLLSEKQRMEKELSTAEICHFSKLNNEPYTDISQIFG